MRRVPGRQLRMRIVLKPRPRMRVAEPAGAHKGGAEPAHAQSGPRRRRDAALEITARYCRNEMEQYGRCVAASPASWQRDCHRLRLSIARCAAAHPIVQQIRQDCAEPFSAFEQCLKENQASVINCSDHVNAFLLCADQVKLST
ncbi:coiled-coil-helix-coiled-coil-helix domain-containing protein 5 [Aegotheles albertisi]